MLFRAGLKINTPLYLETHFPVDPHNNHHKNNYYNTSHLATSRHFDMIAYIDYVYHLCVIFHCEMFWNKAFDQHMRTSIQNKKN